MGVTKPPTKAWGGGWGRRWEWRCAHAPKGAQPISARSIVGLGLALTCALTSGCSSAYSTSVSKASSSLRPKGAFGQGWEAGLGWKCATLSLPVPQPELSMTMPPFLAAQWWVTHLFATEVWFAHALTVTVLMRGQDLCWLSLTCVSLTWCLIQRLSTHCLPQEQNGGESFPSRPWLSGPFPRLSQILLMSVPGSAALLWGDRHWAITWPLPLPKKPAWEKKKTEGRKTKKEEKELNRKAVRTGEQRTGQPGSNQGRSPHATHRDKTTGQCWSLSKQEELAEPCPMLSVTARPGSSRPHLNTVPCGAPYPPLPCTGSLVCTTGLKTWDWKEKFISFAYIEEKTEGMAFPAQQGAGRIKDLLVKAVFFFSDPKDMPGLQT